VTHALRLELRLVAGVAKLLGAFAYVARPEDAAALGADLVGAAVGTIRRDIEDTFHGWNLQKCDPRIRCGARSCPFRPRRSAGVTSCKASDAPKLAAAKRLKTEALHSARPTAREAALPNLCNLFDIPVVLRADGFS
jgi:hypothetical protein